MFETQSHTKIEDTPSVVAIILGGVALGSYPRPLLDIFSFSAFLGCASTRNSATRWLEGPITYGVFFQWLWVRFYPIICENPGIFSRSFTATVIAVCLAQNQNSKKDLLQHIYQAEFST